MKNERKAVEVPYEKINRDRRILDVDISELVGLADLTPAPLIDLGREIEMALLEHRAPPLVELVRALEDVCRRHAFREMAEKLREKLHADATPEAAAVRTVLLGKTESARAEAKRLGVSHTAVLRARRKARGFQKVSINPRKV